MCVSGADRLVKHFLNAGIPIAIATGSAQTSYQAKISTKLDLFGKISHAVCSDDPEVKEGKPSPHIYQVAAARFKDSPKSTTNVRRLTMLLCMPVESGAGHL